ncbi:MAG TPA: hypothetical protein VLG91_03835, partial [Streptomyces sp.]|nr:hypothetical protein [Streptomyces sp.]
MIPAMPATKAPAHRSRRRPRPSGGGASVALRYGRLAAMGAIAVVLLIAGVWGSWGYAQHVMLSKGREQGTMTVARCADETCWGPY